MTSTPARESLLRFAPSMVALLVVVACGTNAADVDLWGHLRFGADTLARGHLAMHDPYSYSIRGLPWINHEWLSEVVLAWSYAKLGVVGLKMVRFVCAAITIVCLAGAIAESAAAVGVQLAVMIVVTICLVPEMEFRPQMFTYAFLSVTMWLIARDNFRGRSPVWIAIPMVVVWSNLHGGFVTGIAALGLYSGMAGLQDWYKGRGLARGIRVGSITVASIVASLATPYGLGTWWSVARTISRPPFLSEIIEWQRLPSAMLVIWNMPGLSKLFDIGIVSVMGGLAACVALAPSTDDLPLLVVAAVMISAAFSAFRNVSLGVIGSAVPLAHHLSAAIHNRREAAAQREAAPPRERASTLTQLIVATLAIVLALKLGIFSDRVSNLYTMPEGAVTFMANHGLRGNVLSALVFSDYLLYHRAPESHVFIDTRLEMIYPDRLVREYLDFHHGRAQAARILDLYPNDFVLIEPASGAESLMRTRTDWKLIYEDSDSMLYARADSGAAHIDGLPIIAAAPAAAFP